MNPRVLILTAAAAAIVFGATGDPVAYREGTIQGIPANAGGKLELDGKNVVFHYGNNHLAIPYQNITAVELSGPPEWKEPAYKFWKKFPASTDKDRRLTLRFNAEPNVNKMMVFTVSPLVGENIRRSIDSVTGKSFSDKPAPGTVTTTWREDWWGDRIWKTSRNSGQWSRTSGNE